MPNVVSTAETVIEITTADFTELVSKSLSALQPANAELHAPAPRSVPDERVFELVFPIDATFLDGCLRALIPNLPPLGSYTAHAAPEHPGIVGVVRWSDK